MANFNKQFFEKHHTRLVWEGIWRSAVSGLIVGFGANFIAAALAWLLDFGGIGFAVGTGAIAAVLGGVLMYFIKYRPSAEEIARRVDRLGLEERLVTMMELKDDDSFIATVQRENAKQHLQDVASRKLRIRLSKAMVATVIVAALLGGSMTTVVALVGENILPPVSDIIRPEDPWADHIAVTFVADEGGEIHGEADQLVLPGEDATPVVAVAEDGWMFVGWDDGGNNPERWEKGVTKEIYLVALFEPVQEGEGESEGGQEDAGGGEEGDEAEDLPAGGDANVNTENGGDGDKGSGSGSDSNNDGGKGDSEEEGEGKGDGKGQGAGGKWDDSNKFIDGNQYYRDYLDMYYQMAQEIFEETGEIPPELREFFEMYFGSI